MPKPACISNGRTLRYRSRGAETSATAWMKRAATHSWMAGSALLPGSSCMPSSTTMCNKSSAPHQPMATAMYTTKWLRVKRCEVVATTKATMAITMEKSSASV